MRNGMTLYKAELRKILCKKSVWIAMVLGTVLVVLLGITNFSVDGGAYVKYQETVLTELSGQAMDQAFFERFHDEINTEIQDNWNRYEFINDYDPSAIPQNAVANIGKDALYDYIYNVVRDRDAILTVTADEFYAAMRADIIKDGRELGSSNEEIDTWLERFDSIPTPIAYSYALSYQNILDDLFLIGWVLFLNIAVALAGVYADEKTYRTDAMILSAKNGRAPICAAKLFAGMTVSLMQTAVLLGIGIGTMFAFYGTSGWNAMIQLVIPSSPWNITIGTMVLIYFVLAIVSSILFALTNMAVSHFTHSAVATMAIHAAVLFAGLFNMPAKLGLLAKLWQLRPTMALYYGTFCNTYMYGKLNNVEISVLLYAGIAVILAIVLMLTYRKSQVESR